jgi:predicted nucleic acid-binding Zn ribbon protein
MQSIQDLFPLVARLIQAAPPSEERTQCAWRLAVGPVLGRVTRARLAGDGSVTVEAEDARWRTEIVRARPVILERLRQVLGAEAARTLVVAGEPDRSRRRGRGRTAPDTEPASPERRRS